MRIFVCPVSGGAFPIQLGLISELSLVGVRPDIVMGSSGGNVASYIGLASQWKAEDIPKYAAQINSKMFVTSWWPSWLSVFPSWWIGYWKGSIYADGSGSLEMFKKNFTMESITQTELWTGTLNRQTGKGQLFSNKNPETSYIKPRNPDLLSSFWTRDCMPLTYLDGDVERIALVTMASASIPVLVPEKVIDGNRYVDGGTLFSSPLTALQDRVREFAEEGSLHIDYISSFDMQTITTSTYRSLYDNGTQTIGELVKSLCVQDRLVAIEILRTHLTNVATLHFAAVEGNQENLRMIEKVRSTCQYSVLELYPLENASLDLLTFKPTDIVNLINQAKSKYGLRFWWIGDEAVNIGVI